MDVVISPVVNLELPLAGSIIKGNTTALRLAQWLQPQVFFLTAAGGDVEYQGFLTSLLRTVGSVDELRSQLAQNNLPSSGHTPSAWRTGRTEAGQSSLVNHTSYLAPVPD